MNPKRLIIGAAVGILVMALGVWWLRPREEKREGYAQKVADSGTSAPGSNPVAGGNSSNSPTPVVSPEQETAGEEQTLGLVGSVQSGDQATLSARMPARILAIPAHEGDNVRRGQLLVRLDPQDFQMQERTAQAGVAAARAQLRKAEVGRNAQKVKADSDVATAQAGLNQAQTKQQQATVARDAARDENQTDLKLAQEGVHKAELGLSRAQETLHGLEELAKVGGVSKSDLEGARTQVKVAQSDLDTAQAQAQRLEAGPGGVPYRVALAQKDADTAQAGVQQAQAGLRSAEEARRQTLALAQEDIRAAQAALQQAQAGVTGAQEAQNAMRLLSPLDGVVGSVSAHAGETAQPGAPLLTVVSLTGLRAEALVPARQLARLRVGQPARVQVDTRPGQNFAATVSEIARSAEPDGRTFRVRFRFQDAHLALRPGQTARITALLRRQ